MTRLDSSAAASNSGLTPIASAVGVAVGQRVELNTMSRFASSGCDCRGVEHHLDRIGPAGSVVDGTDIERFRDGVSSSAPEC